MINLLLKDPDCCMPPAGSQFVLVFRQREELPSGAWRRKLFSTDRVGRCVALLIQSDARLTAPVGTDWSAVNATDSLSSQTKM